MNIISEFKFPTLEEREARDKAIEQIFTGFLF
jgi:hypothetical protein